MKKTLTKHVFFLFLLILSTTAWAQSTVTGIIKDADGNALPGVSIVVEGTTQGTISDAEGKYSLQVKNQNASLSFSFIGFQSQTIPVGNQNTINVTLNEDVELLSEVVVVGYGTVKKTDLTGSVASVKLDEVKDIPANSVERVLQGRAAGLQVTTNSQDPGAGATVRIRGGSSLLASSDPLVVVDGFPLGSAGDLKQINPADIESVEVLKDASASAIYGSRGANGVIIISTRKAKTGKTEFSIKQQTTVSQFTSKLNLWRDPVLMAQLSNESRTNGDGFQPIYVGANDPSGVYYPSVEELASGEWPYYTEWDDVVFRDTPISNNTTFSVASSNEKTNFTLSANYFTDKGVYINDDYSKINYNLHVSHKLSDKLKVGFSNILTRGKRNSNGGLAYWRNPIFPVYDDEGDYFLVGNNDYSHPMAITENVTNTSKTLDVLSFLDVEYKIMPSLVLTSRLNYKYGTSISDQFYPSIYTEAGNFNNGAAFLNNWQGTTLVSETFANYNKEINKHQFGVTLGYSYQTDETRTSSLGAYDFANEVLKNENLAAGNPESNTVNNGLSKSELVSGIFRVNYTYNNKYLITFTSRADGSSKFGANNKWAFFPSAAISWKAHEEDFIKDLDIFDQLKFRYSYGVSGNQGISPYETLSRYGVSKYYVNGKWTTAIGPGREVGRSGQGGIEVLWGGIPNPDLKWETTTQSDFGVNMGFFENKLNVTFDYYSKNTEDLLHSRILTPSSGYDRMTVNYGSVTNKGIELTLDGNIIQNDDWSVNTTLIYSKNKNEVTDLGNVVESGLITDPNTGMLYEYFGNSIEAYRDYPNLLAVGQPVNVFYGYKTNGIVQSLEDGIEAGLEGEEAQPGEFKYVDINGDGQITPDDKTIIGDPNPDFTASLNLSVTYKKFDFSIFFNGVFGNDVLNTQAFNQPSELPLRWTPDNPTNEYPALREGRSVRFSDWWLEDGSFVRIQNINLGYTLTLPKNMSARVFLNASNLYTFTKFDGYDPEVGSDGRYWGGYPRLRKVTLGVNLKF
ncbi:SusC/RagA family TonB-linked outer membrane protein [Fulvivirga ligni]|uniref:SusC/RagA family TonB-linked outer membrane protein n=1 Tax=Fulvivirga ligni TaxID=2904246 RepID=UPI001F2255E5|nr:TonB-dependent receptor [Fulvivirga ligni]UII20683.1 TonB-dependent receptor [Fulvivirga ligni]